MPLLNLPFMQEKFRRGGGEEDAARDLVAQLSQQKQQEQQQQNAIRNMILQAVLTGKGSFGGEDGGGLNELATGRGMPDLGNYSATPESPTTSISVTPYSFDDRLQAQNILGFSPQSLARDPDMKHLAEKVGGTSILGNPTAGGGGFGSRWEFTPEFENIRGEAQQVLGGPGKTTYRQTGKFTGKPVIEKSAQPQTQQVGRFSGKGIKQGAATDDVQPTDALIEEYNTTNDPQRLQELETILEGRGVVFE